MKKQLFILSSMMLLFVSSVFAFETSLLNVTSESNYLKINLETKSTQTLDVQIKDKFGSVLYQEVAPKSMVEQRKYNLAELPSGEYILEVTQGNIIRLQPFAKNETSLVVANDEQVTLFAPHFEERYDFVDLNLFCSPAFQTTVLIYDENGEVLYRHDTNESEKIEKRFNMSGLDDGTYTFAVEASTSFYSKAFSKTIEMTGAQVSL